MATFQKIRLKEICDRIDYGYTASASQNDVGPKFLRITDIVPSLINWEGVPQCEISKSDKIKYLLADGDIVIARTGATTGYAKCLKNPPESVFASYLVRFRINNSYDKRFVGHVIESNLYKEFVTRNLGGAAQPQANAQILGSYELSIPDLPTQTRIASVLSAYDDLIENNEKRIKVLEEMAQLLYTEWFVKFKFPGHENVKMVDCGTEYGMIPDGWEVKPLSSFVKYISRGLTPKYDDQGATKVINQKCIRNQRLSLDESRTQSKTISAEKLLYFGDILINSTGVGTLGRVAQVYEQLHGYTADTHVTIVRPTSDDYIDFLGLAAFHHQSDFERLGAGATGQTELSRDSIGSLKLVAPQYEIMEGFSQKVRASRMDAINLQNINQILGQTRDILMPQLVTGRREVN